jgi:hypothetical protein
MFKKILTLGSMLAMAALVNPAEAADRECKSFEVHKTGAAAMTMIGAKYQARKAWRWKVLNNYNKKWSSWNVAANARYSCSKIDGKKRCKAMARPCKTKTPLLRLKLKQCKPYDVHATSRAVARKAWAKSAAKAAWKAKVRDYYGKDWDNLIIANSKRYECNVVGGKHSCTAKAFPCKVSVNNN